MIPVYRDQAAVIESAKDIQFGTELPMDKEVLSTRLRGTEVPIPLSVDRSASLPWPTTAICRSGRTEWVSFPKASSSAGTEWELRKHSPTYGNIFFCLELYDLDSDSNGLHLTEAI